MDGLHRGHSALATWRSLPLAAACALALWGCGGGGGGAPDNGARDIAGGSAGGEPGALAIELEAPQTVGASSGVQLRWKVQGGAQSFQVFVQRAAAEAFEPVDARIVGHSAQFARGAAWRYDFPSAKVRVQACDPRQQCVQSNEQPLETVLFDGVATLRFTDPSQFVRWGRHVALSADGDTLAVSARNFGSVVAPRTEPSVGSVTMFHRGSDGAWQRIVELNRFGIDDLEFGLTMALSGDGNTLAVGAPNDLVPRPPPPGGVEPYPLVIDGAVHLYTRDAQDRWTRQLVLRAQPGDFDFFFGARVVLSHDGKRMVVGGFQRTYLFDRVAENTWQQSAVVDAVGPLAIAANGGTFAVGWADVEYNDLELPPAIPVLVYEPCPCGGAGWRRAAVLRTPVPPDDGSGFVFDSFGASLAFSGDGKKLAVGAPGDGKVYLFGTGDGGWTQRTVLSSPAEGDRMGFRVVLSGDGQLLTASARGRAANTPGLRRNHRVDAVPHPDANLVSALYFFEADAQGAWQRTAATLLSAVEVSDFSTSIALSADASTYAAGVMPRLQGAGEDERVAVY